MSSNLTQLTESELNNTLSSITSNINDTNKKISHNQFKEFVLSQINSTTSMNLIIRNISLYINVNNDFGFELFDILSSLIISNELVSSYLSSLLASLQGNINGNDIKNLNFVINSYENILAEIKDSEYVDNFEILNGFCIYNMKDKSNANRLIGIKTHYALISRNYQRENVDSNAHYLQNFWDNIMLFLDKEDFNYKKELLDNVDLIIENTKEKFADYAGMTLYKLLDFLIEQNQDLKMSSLNIILKLSHYCLSAIVHLKEQIKNFLDVVVKTGDDKVKDICHNIMTNLNANTIRKLSDISEVGMSEILSNKDEYSKLEDVIKSSICVNEDEHYEINDDKVFKDVNDLPLKVDFMSNEKKRRNSDVIDNDHISLNCETETKKHLQMSQRKEYASDKKNTKKNKNKRNINCLSQESNKTKKSDIVITTISSKEPYQTQNDNKSYYTQKDVNKISSMYESQISSLISKMKTMSDKQLHLLDVITNLQKNSTEQITQLTSRINQLEKSLLSLSKQKKNNHIKDNSTNAILKSLLNSNDEDKIINKISSLTLNQIKDIDVKLIEDILLRICTIVTKGNYIHEIIMFIKTVVISSSKFNKLRSLIIRNLKDVLEFLNDDNNGIYIKDEDLIDISLLLSFLNKQ